MPLKYYDREGAKRAGLTDQEIDSYIRSQGGIQAAAPVVTVAPNNGGAAPPAAGGQSSSQIYDKNWLTAKITQDPVHATAYQKVFDANNPAPEKPVLPSADEKKKADAKVNATRIVTQLEDAYFNANNGKGLAAGRVGGLLDTLKSGAGLNADLNAYDALRTSIRPTLARAAGDVGNLSAPEQSAAVKNIPTQFSTPEEARQYFADVRQKFGLNERNINPNKNKGTPLGFILGGARNVAQDIGAGLAGNTKDAQALRQTQQTNAALAQQLEQAAAQKQQSNPQQALKLMQAAQKNYQETGNQAQQTANQYSADVADNPWLRGLGAANEIATAADLGSGLVGKAAGGNPTFEPFVRTRGVAGQSALMQLIPGLGKKAVPTGVSSVKDALGLTAGKGSALRNTAVDMADEAGKTVNGNNIVSFMEDWATTAKQANPGKVRQIDKVVQETKDAWEKGKVGANDVYRAYKEVDSGFTQKGITKTSLEASSDRALRTVLRKELDKIAPGFDQGTELIRKGLGRKDLLKTGGKIAGGAAISGAAYAALQPLFDLLAGRNKGG